MGEEIWYTQPFDDDDEDFIFEDGHAELASELREYSDDDDDEFDEFERAMVTINLRAPVVPPAPPVAEPIPVAPPAKPAKAAAPQKTPAKKATAKKK